MDVKKIDIHAHATTLYEFYPLRKADDPHSKLLSPEILIDFYDRLNVEKGVLLPVVSPEGQYSTITSEACKFITEKYPDRFIWFCNIDPRSGANKPDFDFSVMLEHYKSLGARGVGEITAKIYADDPRLDNLFSCCEEYDMPVTIHISPSEEVGSYGIIDEIGLPRLEKMLKKHPKLKVFGHSQPFYAEISSDITEELRNRFPKGKVQEGRIATLMREYENLYCDLSAGSGANAMQRDPEYAVRI